MRRNLGSLPHSRQEPKTGRVQNPQASKTRPVGLDGGPKQWALSLWEKEKHFTQKRYGSLGKPLIQPSLDREQSWRSVRNVHNR